MENKKHYAIFHRDTKELCGLEFCDEEMKNIIEEADDKKAQLIEVKEELIIDEGFNLTDKYVFTFLDDTTVRVKLNPNYNPLEQIREQKTRKIKAECKKRIYEAFPNWKQRNIDREALMAFSGMTKVNVQAATEKQKEMHRQIDLFRNSSNILENLAGDMTLEELKEFDASSNEHWL